MGKNTFETDVIERLTRIEDTLTKLVAREDVRDAEDAEIYKAIKEEMQALGEDDLMAMGIPRMKDQ